MAIADAAALIGETTRRVIWAGGGVVSGNAAAQLQRLAEALDAPVFTSGNGRGAIPEDHALAMGPLTTLPEFRETLAAAELVIAVGTRFQGNATGNWTLKLPRLIHIDADAAVVNRNYHADVAVIGDAGDALAALLAAQNAQPGDPEFLRSAQQRRDVARSRDPRADGSGSSADHGRDPARAAAPWQYRQGRDGAGLHLGQPIAAGARAAHVVVDHVRGNRSGSAAGNRRGRRDRREDRRDSG